MKKKPDLLKHPVNYVFKEKRAVVVTCEGEAQHQTVYAALVKKYGPKRVRVVKV